jgi:gamma-glutamyl:cysteine ligase YbdK (ATP-grasp superfamily)
MFFCVFLLVALSCATAQHLLRENNLEEEEEEEDPLADALDENEVDATVVGGKSNVRSILLRNNIFFYSL